MNDSLTLEDVRDLAPAAFSRVPHPRVSDRYSLFSTADIVSEFVKEGWEITRAGQSAIRTPQQELFSRHLVAFSRPELTYHDLRIEALLFNSNDGRSAYHFELGAYRFICANGMVDADAKLSEVELKHFGYTQEQVTQASGKILERAPEVLAVIDAWKAKELSFETQLELAKFALALRFPAPPPIAAEDLLLTRRPEDRGNSLWAVFNKVQENTLKGGNSYVRPTKPGERAQRRQKVRPIRSIGTNLKLNRGLWQAAEAVYAGQDLVLPA